MLGKIRQDEAYIGEMMKISELIDELKTQLEKNGDIKVLAEFSYSTDWGQSKPEITIRNENDEDFLYIRGI